ncbi:hypothetical protein LINGRAPRIM_LOCUS2026 [Linum grandiflorum]
MIGRSRLLTRIEKETVLRISSIIGVIISLLGRIPLTTSLLIFLNVLGLI